MDSKNNSLHKPVVLEHRREKNQPTHESITPNPRRPSEPSERGSLQYLRYPAITKSDFTHGWALPGAGKSREDCGEVRHKGCLNTPKHPEGKAFVKAYRKSCMKASCPICWRPWSVKRSHRVAHRMRSFKPSKYRSPIHVVFSPPEHEYLNLSGVKGLRQKMYKLSKIVGLYGGMSVFHPYRCGTGEWHFSPHFHTLGYGWVHGTKEVYENDGWIIKNIGVRKDVVRVSIYLLSHAGIKEKQHTITWFGELGYAKLKISPEEEEEKTCPYCQAPLVLLEWFATDRGPPIDDAFEGLIDSEGWSVKVSEWQLGRTGMDIDSFQDTVLRRYDYEIPMSSL